MRLAALELYFRTRGDDRIVVPFMPWWYSWVQAQLTASAVTVPCDGCGARCCRANRIELLPGLDDPAQYRTTESRGALVLARRVDGACCYLSEDDRCTIHDRAPMMCRTYDCRVYSASQSVILDDQTNGTELTLSCEAGLTRFVVVARNLDDARAMAAVKEQRTRVTAEGFEGNVAVGAALLTWPRLVGGPALHYLQRLETRAPVALRAAVSGRAGRT
jgi:Fe-S-cluster containining protein